MKFLNGIDRLLDDQELLATLKRARTGLVAHPASITRRNTHSLDELISAGCNVVKAFGPQHGMRGDVQDNMIETEDSRDPDHGIPVLSLYGQHRYPTEEMLADLDIILFDLQDVGCRIYTYITTLKYFIEAAGASNCALWILDRPNPAGRPVDGLRLEAGQESFVGSDVLPTRHGLTTGELALWFNSRSSDPCDLRIIEMQDYRPLDAPGYGWPVMQIPWVNPSPNAASLNMTRCFPGTVLLEGTTLSEGRGTTVPLEVIGAPGLEIRETLALLKDHAPHWLDGIYLRPCFFLPTFHKHVGEMCAGLQIHTDYADYRHEVFKPYRLVAGLLKCVRARFREYDLWREHEYEYEPDRLPIDVINGGPALRHWVDDDSLDFTQFENQLDETADEWCIERAPFLRY